MEGIGPVKRRQRSMAAPFPIARYFATGIQFAKAWLGLVPQLAAFQRRQDKQQVAWESASVAIRIFGMLLIHGARSVVYRWCENENRPSQPLDSGEKEASSEPTKQALAVANKKCADPLGSAH